MASESRRHRRGLWVLLALAFAASCGCIPSCNLVQARDQAPKRQAPGRESIEHRQRFQVGAFDAGGDPPEVQVIPWEPSPPTTPDLVPEAASGVEP